MAMRNLAPATLVLVPVVAGAFRIGAGSSSVSSSSGRRAPGGPVALAVIGVCAALFVAATVARPAYKLWYYPVEELAWMEDHDLLDGKRVAAPVYVGNYRTWAEGAHGQVFQDDRFDMYPTAVQKASIALRDASKTWQESLDEFDIDAVLWPTTSPLATVLRVAPGWTTVHETDKWIVAVRA
jgi:hypothetical protein